MMAHLAMVRQMAGTVARTVSREENVPEIIQ